MAMKNKNGKDERLDSLFSDYMSEKESPSINVTLKAKEYMRQQKAKVAVTERVAVTDTGDAVVTDGALGNRRIAAYCGAFLLTILLLTAVILIGNMKGNASPSDGFLQSVMSSGVSELEGRTAEYSAKEFIPFVEESSVSEYREYAEKKKTASDPEDGKTVAYYLEYTVDGVKTRLYVQENGAVDSSEASDGTSVVADISQFMQKANEKDPSRYGFSHDGYIYYFEFETTDRKAIDQIVGKIKKSF